MTSRFPLTHIVILVAVIGLAFANYLVEPEKLIKWIIAALMVPAFYGIVQWLKASGACTCDSELTPHQMENGLVSAGMMFIAIMMLTLLENLGFITDRIGDAASGVVIGLFVMAMGNNIPKRLTPLDRERSTPAHSQPIKRFAGWAYVLGGLFYALAFVIFPEEQADNYALIILIAATGAVALRMLLAKSPSVEQ